MAGAGCFVPAILKIPRAKQVKRIPPQMNCRKNTATLSSGTNIRILKVQLAESPVRVMAAVAARLFIFNLSGSFLLTTWKSCGKLLKRIASASMKFLNQAVLDTNVVIALFAGEPRVIATIRRKQNLLLPVIVLGELHYGALRSSRREDNLHRLEEFARQIRLLNCDLGTALKYGAVKGALAAKGRPIPENDCWIAALALQHKATVLTHDAHFAEVDGLRVELLAQ